MKRLLGFLLRLGFGLGMVAPALAVEWHHPLYLDGGGYWHQRIGVQVRNDSDETLNGRPVALAIGSAAGEAALTGARAESVRVCDPQGEEMLYAITDAQGGLQTRGVISAGGRLTIPVECPARQSATYYVYFENPSAGEVPDFLAQRLGLSNGDVEQGEGDTPTGWHHDEPDAQHRASWSSEQPQSGRRCLKTVVSAGAEPSWIATRQTGIPIVGGGRYEMKAWVRAENVQGDAGWYIHVGNRKNAMMLSPTLAAGQGTFGWKQVTLDFTAPVDADRADLGTVLRGTGTAWFDHVSLASRDVLPVRAVADQAERLNVRETGADTPWPTAPRARSARRSR